MCPARGPLLACLALLTVAGPARADMGVPWERRANLTHRVSTGESFPDHVFVLIRPTGFHEKTDDGKDQWHRAYTVESVQLAPDQPLVVQQEPYRGVFRLLIVPREIAARYGTVPEMAEALAKEEKEIPGVVRYVFPYRESVGQWESAELTIEYRVERTAAVRIKVVRLPTPARYLPCVACCLSPFALGFGGLWVIRRRRKRRVTGAPLP